MSAYPGYRSTALLDKLRVTEYSYLDAGGHVYLDYTGAGLPAQAQLIAHAERIRGQCFGEPHSENPISAASTELIERARLAVLAHLSAPPDEYAAIFTPNATGACRLVGEAYPLARHRTQYPIVPSMLPQGLLQMMLGTEFFRRTADGSRNAAVSRWANASLGHQVPWC